MKSVSINNIPPFLRGGGQMGSLIREFDWASTSVGQPQFWPVNLQVTVSLILNSKFPMLIFWGEQLEQLYNDAYRPVFGNNGKHPKALGQKAEECWPEIWQSIFPMLKHVKETRDASWSEDQLLPIFRNGVLEDAYWTFSYSPIIGTQDKVEGILVTCLETTEKIIAKQRLEKSEVSYRSMADNIPNLAWMADADGWIYWYNQKWYEYTGTTSEQMAGWGWQSVHHPEKLSSVLENWQWSIESGEPFEMVFPLKGSDGRFRDFLTRVLPVKDQSGKIYQWFGTNTDISERTAAEQALIESENRFRSLADHSPIIIFIIEPTEDIAISYWNQTWLDYTGQTLSQALGRAWDGLVHPDDIDGVFKIYVPAFNDRKSYQLPAVRIKRHDGVYRWHLFKSNPRYLSSGEFIGYVGVGFDIHERKLSEDSLKESEERFRTLAETLPQMIWVMNTDGRIEYGSKSWKEYSGIDNVSEAWSYMMHPDDNELLTLYWNQVFANGKGYQHEVRLKNKEGVYRWFYSVGEPVRDAENKVIKWVGSLTDIHEQKSFTEKLEGQVSERTKELKESNSLLERSNEDLQQFAHVTSHDFKEPVRKIKTFLNLIASDSDSSLSSRSALYIKKVLNSSERLNNMIEGVLSYSSVNALDLQTENVDLNSVMEDIKIDLEVLIEEKKAVLNISHLPTVKGFPVLLYQLFYNLINNSLKFTKQNQIPLITIQGEIEMEVPTSYAVIKLQDNGVGFEPEYATKIFNTFFRLHSKDQFEGTGLGLALCKKIVERHGGIIQAEGKVNEGALFVIKLPLN